jgi:hypothetical protein
MLPSCGCLAAIHGFTHKGQPSRKAWEVHNPAIYRGMTRY